MWKYIEGDFFFLFSLICTLLKNIKGALFNQSIASSVGFWSGQSGSREAPPSCCSNVASKAEFPAQHPENIVSSLSSLTGQVAPAKHQSGGAVSPAWTAGVWPDRYTEHMFVQSMWFISYNLCFCLVSGELVEPLQVSCTCLEDYQNWIFQLQQVRQFDPHDIIYMFNEPLKHTGL